MARIATTLADLLTSARQVLVDAGIFTESQAFLTLDPDDLMVAPPASPFCGLTFNAFNQRLDTMDVEVDEDQEPTMEGELLVACWIRIALDRANKDAYLLTDQTRGASQLVRKIVRALQNKALENEDGDVLVWRTLNFMGFANRGKWAKDKNWRRIDVRFNCCWSMTPVVLVETPFTTVVLVTGTWAAPANLVGSTVSIQAVGRGGSGGGGGGFGGEGGGGGAYASGAVTVTSGNSYTVTISNTFSTFTGDGGSLIKAQAGQDGTEGFQGQGGLASASTGTVKFSGGIGGLDGIEDTGGPGGGAGGPNGNGQPGTDGAPTSPGASGGSPGGAGGNGGTGPLEPGSAGENYGGGGGGPGAGGTAGAGAGGVIIITGSTYEPEE
jgi:hypothetical protein